MEAKLNVKATMGAVLTRKDGTVVDLGVVGEAKVSDPEAFLAAFHSPDCPCTPGEPHLLRMPITEAERLGLVPPAQEKG